jgi:opacity protein-like surface antigen
VDGGLGYRFNRWIRAEALVSWLPDLNFQGQSNFRGAAGSNQPVKGAVSSVAGFGVAYVDLPRFGEVRPFLGAGLGVARNRIEALNFRFPRIAPTASTTIPGGSSSDLAYLLTAGISLPLSGRLELDLAYRFSDLGSVKTSGARPKWCAPPEHSASRSGAPRRTCRPMACW